MQRLALNTVFKALGVCARRVESSRTVFPCVSVRYLIQILFRTGMVLRRGNGSLWSSIPLCCCRLAGVAGGARGIRVLSLSACY